jgi:hypothetical protein
VGSFYFIFIYSDPDYEFYCELCDKRLGDIETAALHASTEKHRRQVRYESETQEMSKTALRVGDYDVIIQNVIERGDDSSTAGRCPLCCVSLSDTYQLMQHVTSRKHKTNLDWYQRVHAARALGKFLSVKDLDSRFGSSGYDGASYDKILPHSSFIISEEIVSFIRNLPHGVVVREWEYFCMHCDVKLVSDDFVTRHGQGIAHSNVRPDKRFTARNSNLL